MYKDSISNTETEIPLSKATASELRELPRHLITASFTPEISPFNRLERRLALFCCRDDPSFICWGQNSSLGCQPSNEKA